MIDQDEFKVALAAALGYASVRELLERVPPEEAPLDPDAHFNLAVARHYGFKCVEDFMDARGMVGSYLPNKGNFYA